MKPNVAGWQKRVGDPAQRQHLRRRRPGTCALQEIRFYQKSTCFLISMRGFQRYVRQVVLDENNWWRAIQMAGKSLVHSTTGC